MQQCHAAKRDVHVWNTTLRDYPLSLEERDSTNLRATQISAVHGILALDLSGNSLTDVTAEVIASYISTDVWLSGLNLSRNQIGGGGLQLLVQAVEGNPHITTLGLASNPGRRQLDDK